MKRKMTGTRFHFPTAAIFLFILAAPLLRGQTAQEIDSYTDPPFWRQALGGAVTGHPVAQVESVVATTDGGNLKSYSWQGAPLWDYYARGRLVPLVSRSREGTSYICRTNGLLLAVNRSGRELWQINLRTPIIYPVLTGWDGRLFVFTNGKITCMTAAGYTLWTRAIESKLAFAPSADSSGGIILVQEDGEVISIDPFGTAYSYRAEKLPAAATTMNIYGWGPTVLLLHEDRGMELVYPDMKYGETYRGRLDLPAAPLAAKGRAGEAAVLLKDGRVSLVSPELKKVLWTEASHIRAGELPDRPGGDELDIIFDERGVYVVTKNGATGFAPDGRRLWTMRLRGAAAIPSFGEDGVLFSGGEDWILYAYRLESRIRAKPRALYGEVPEGSYGTANPRPSSQADNYFRFSEEELEGRFSEIRQAVMEGSIGKNEKDYVAWLMEVSGSLMENPRTGNHPPVQTRHRVEAARLLAFMGSRETIPFLADLFGRDPEILVKAAAAEAIGRIGVDPEGYALRAFENAVAPSSPLRDDTILVSLARATGALCRFSGPPLSEAGIRILTILSGADKPPIARRQAEAEIRSFRR